MDQRRYRLWLFAAVALWTILTVYAVASAAELLPRIPAHLYNSGLVCVIAGISLAAVGRIVHEVEDMRNQMTGPESHGFAQGYALRDEQCRDGRCQHDTDAKIFTFPQPRTPAHVHALHGDPNATTLPIPRITPAMLAGRHRPSPRGPGPGPASPPFGPRR